MLDLPGTIGRRDGAGRSGAVAAAPGLPAWDTELLLVRGADRADLVGRARSLQRYLAGHGAVDLKDLAYTLNTETGGPTGSCLALVAGSVEHLRLRLASALERLGDPQRTQIKDAAGVYYVDRPLRAEGSLALLFPGEGGEYLNMLADLCPHFPEVEETFAKAERLAWNASPAAGERFARLFRLPATASAGERAEAEKALVQLDAIASGILLADWAMFALLTALGVAPAAMAGHSLGEIAALQACGAIGETEEQLVHVGSVLNQLVTWEEAGAITPSMLLAVGAGRPAIEGIVRDTVGSGVFLAMDNCPHQTIVVGPRDLMEVVEAELKARRFICERLPFDVPYHTPMFDPYLGPFRELFDKIPFRSPAGVALYSFSTGRPFPSDPAGIREHAVRNLAQPVEFTSLVRNMHADGVRLFVECGPRGNLTSFVEDILRHERFAAVASNLPTRSGVTQLNHLAGQLAAHHVPLRHEHLYLRRSPRRLAWEDRGDGRAGPVADEESVSFAEDVSRAAPDDLASEGLQADDLQADDLQASDLEPDDLAPDDLRLPGPAALSGRGEVVAQHLALMEQFLDGQVEVMAAYLGRARQRHAEAGGRELPAADDGPAGLPEAFLPAPAEDAAPALAALPLLATATVVAFEAGREIVVRRPLDLAEDLFASHHTVGAHVVSKVDPDQHSLPVMPMTFSLEIMAELATCLVPGCRAIGVENVRLLQWLAFDDDEGTAIEACARLLPDPPADPNASWQVALEIHVLGGGASTIPGRVPAAQGVVLLGDEFPAAPAAGDFPLANEHASTIPVEVLYRNLFHGPLFQGTRSCGRSGDEGAESEIEVLPRGRLLRSGPDPRFLMDPVTLDVGLHPISAWHLEFPDQSGRILLPVELKRIDLFGAQLAPGTRLTSRSSIHRESYRHFVHSVDLIGPDGRLWSRMRDLTFWRFYSPYAEVNFFGPKDEYFISRQWEVGLARSSLPACCIRLDIPPDQKQKAMRTVTSRMALSPGEIAQYRTLGGDEKQETPWLFGRLAAKDAVRVVWHARHGERLFPADIVVAADPDGGLVAHPRGEATEPFPDVAVAHLGDVAVSVAAFGTRVGIALERVPPRERGAGGGGGSEAERAVLDAVAGDRDEWIARFSSAREAVGQALGGDAADLPGALVVRTADARTGIVTLAPAGLGPGSRPDPVVAHTARDGDLVVAVCLSERAAP